MTYRLLAAVFLAFALAGAARAVPAAPAVGPEALRGAGPQAAMVIADRWGAVKAGVTSFVTSRAVTFKFADGRTVETPLGGRMLVAIAPYETFTHPCGTHYMSSCKAEFPDAAFKVTARDAGGKVAFSGSVKTAYNGFLELWLPRDKVYSVTVAGRGKTAGGLVSTGADAQTCVTTFKLQ